MELKREIITPELAKKYLGGNEGNRKIRPQVVAAYMADMRNGNWNDSPDIVTPIMISREGRLIDGQHRLTAVVKSGVSVVMYVAHDVEDSVFRYLDAGLKRSAADQLGTADSKLVTAIASRAYASVHGDAPIASMLGGKFTNVEGTRHVTRAETLSYAEDNYEELTSVASQARAMRRSVGTGAPTIYGYFLWLIDWLGVGELADEFSNDFCLIAPQSPTVTAARSIIQRAGTDKNSVISSKWLIGILLCAYEHYRNMDDSTTINHGAQFISKYDRLIKAKRKELAK